MRSTIGVDMAAPPARVFELASDIAQWPALLPHYRQVTMRSREGDHVTATMTAVRRFAFLDIPVSWTSRQWAERADAADLQLRFVHVGGPTRGMDVTWHIRPLANAKGSRVTIEHDFERRLPLLGRDAFPRLVDRLFVRPIAGRTLATFKSLAER